MSLTRQVVEGLTKFDCRTGEKSWLLHTNLCGQSEQDGQQVDSRQYRFSGYYSPDTGGFIW